MRKIYINGQVYTGSLPLCEAFVTEAEHFIYAGSNSLAMTYAGKDTEIVDLKNRFVCAGFNDSHMHLLNLGQTLTVAPLAKHTGSLEEMLQCLSRANPGRGGWILGRGWNQDYFFEEEHDHYSFIITACRKKRHHLGKGQAQDCQNRLAHQRHIPDQRHIKVMQTDEQSPEPAQNVPAPFQAHEYDGVFYERALLDPC